LLFLLPAVFDLVCQDGYQIPYFHLDFLAVLQPVPNGASHVDHAFGTRGDDQIRSRRPGLLKPSHLNLLGMGIAVDEAAIPAA
jgi:hypothetical protein